jgi:hypothetical protein
MVSCPKLKTMKHLMISFGQVLVGQATYGQITIPNDSIFADAEFMGR